MSRLTSTGVILLLCLINGFIASAQNLSAFINNRNEFYAFEDSFTHQLDYLPPLNYKIGGNSIAFIDNKSTLKIYQYGSVSTPINGTVNDYAVTNDLILIRTGSLYVFDQGRLNLLTRFLGSYILGDSVVGFIDFASRNLLAYYNGSIHLLKEGVTDPAATFIGSAGNLLAYKTFDNIFDIYYRDSIYQQETEFPVQVRCGNDVAAYLDQYEDGFRVFFKGATKTIEAFNPRNYAVGNDLIAYTTREGLFKIFWNGSIYDIGNYIPSYFQVKDNLIVYGDRVGYSYVFYQGKSYPLENFIPQNISISQSTLFYYDQSSRLKIFSEGISKSMPIETYITVSNDYDVIKMQTIGNQFRFFSHGKVY